MTWLHDQIVKVCPQLRGINKVLMHICNQDSNSSLWNISLLRHVQPHCRIYDSVLSPISDKDWTMARPLKDVTTERASEASPCQLRRTTAPQNKHVQTHSKSLIYHTSWHHENMNSRRDLRSLNQGAFSASWRSSTCGQKKGGSQPTSVRLDWLMGLLRLESPPFGFVVGHSNRFQHLQCDLKSGCCLWITLFVAHKQVHTRNILYYHHLRSSIIWYTVYSNYILSWCNVQYDTIWQYCTLTSASHKLNKLNLMIP